MTSETLQVTLWRCKFKFSSSPGDIISVNTTRWGTRHQGWNIIMGTMKSHLSVWRRTLSRSRYGLVAVVVRCLTSALPSSLACSPCMQGQLVARGRRRASLSMWSSLVTAVAVAVAGTVIYQVREHNPCHTLLC